MKQVITITNKHGESITLGNARPYYLQMLSGVGEVACSIESQKSPNTDGSKYFKTIIDNREISIEGMIAANTGDEVIEYRRRLQRVVNPKLGECKIQYKHGELIREIDGVAETTPIFPGGKGKKGHLYQTYLLRFVCHKPFWLDTFFESKEMSYLMGGIQFNLHLPTTFAYRGFRRRCVNEGDVNTPVEIIFKGPAVNPTVSNLTTNEWIKVNRALSENDVLSISTAFGEKSVRINGENAFHYIDLNSTFWQLTPGENVLSYESNNDSTKTRVKVKWKNRYIGL